jgi:hypothetical protein
MLRQAFFGGGISLIELLYVIGSTISVCGIIVLFAMVVKKILKNTEAILLSAIALVFIIFAFWWAPHDDSFWFYPAVLILVTIFSLIDFSRFTRNVSYATMIIFALVNITCSFVPSSRVGNSVARTGADALAKLALDENDLVLTNLAQIKLALNYHYSVNVPIKSVAYLEAGPKNEVIDRYRSLLADFEGRVIIFENEIYPESHRRFLFGRFSRSEYTETYRPFLSSLIPADSIRVYGEWITIYELSETVDQE